MSNPITIPAWQRPHWQASDEEILLQFYVFGKFDAVRVPSADYGSPGLPPGIEAVSHYHSALRQWDGYPLKGAMGRMFKDDAPEAWQIAFDAPEVMVVRGRLKDSQATGYLRDTLGVLAGLLDIGGTAILDPQILSLLDAGEWRRKYLIRDGAPIRNHLLILRDGESTPDHSWIHTRGMRKFGRPDISIRQVPDRAVDRAGLLCEKLVELEALGAHFTDGQRLDIEGVPSGVVVHLRGGLDDPQFNNTYVEFQWPA
ncbi:hypothetical protein [Rhodanobacter sp. OK091]|uniref:hypothetical protein n=1 Tax=Rhodanobacter sp. OK091 TaxID=1881037 RepID=UPI00091CCC04|nr:hypothetical protein [Rhodanobacter sp. OK091]SHL82238.1 hypothetical protein SAMN05428972_1400 [Rhodanobacter sp. OK091]